MAGNRSGKSRRKSERPRSSGLLGRLELPSVRISWRALLGIAAASALPWALIATTTLPDALFARRPELALKLSPNHPDALVAKAEQVRNELARADPASVAAELKRAVSTEQPADRPPRDGAANGTEPATLDDSETAPRPRQRRTGPPSAEKTPPPPAAAPAAASAPPEALRQRIRELAQRALAVDPLNARAYRLLGEAGQDSDTTRMMMTAAVQRARRETIAPFWLLNDASQRGDTRAVLENAEILLRTRPALGVYVVAYLLKLGADAEQRRQLVAWLVEPRNVSMRRMFLTTLPRSATEARTPLDIIQDLDAIGAPPSTDDLKPFIELLVRKDLVEVGYYIWLQHLGEEKMRRAGNIFNAGFEDDSSGLPFDWQIATSGNATAEIRRRDDGDGRALQLRFGVGRSELPRLTQVILLAPGDYDFSFDYRVELRAKRGLRWRLHCLYAKRKLLYETEMLLGDDAQWRKLAARLTVPKDPECRAQVLSVIHDARSASEQLISGEAWFDNLSLISATIPVPAAAEQ